MKYLFEIIDEVAKAKTRKEKCQILKDNNHQFVRDWLHGSFDEKIVWDLPKGAPPYVKFDLDSSDKPKSLEEFTRQLAILVKNTPINKKTRQLDKEVFFTNLLQSVHPRDAELIIMMKDKSVVGRFKGLTEKLVKDTFPKLF